MFIETISYQAALFAGLLSFFSPCILPLIPAYFSFITGLSLDELTTGGDDRNTRQKVIFATIAYVCGFSFVFILLGASASFVGGLGSTSTTLGSEIAGTSTFFGGAIGGKSASLISKIISILPWLVRYAGGAIIIVFGLHLLGIINIKKFNFEKRIHMSEKPMHLMGTFIIGMAFGAGWSPCIGPLLGSILIVAGNQNTVFEGIMLLTIYSFGLALPFILISFFINRILEIMKRAKKILIYVNKISGVLLIFLGILLITDKFRLLAGI